MAINLKVNGVTPLGPGRAGHAVALRAAQRFRAQRREVRLRAGAVRRLHRADRRQAPYAPASPRSARLEKSEITTIEGLGTIDKPHALQQAFIEEQAAQCGYCTNGMIMSAKELLDRNPKPSEPDVRAALAGNLCRCGTHNRIIRAVLRAAQANGRT